jgi:hypothetical protein
VSIDFASPEHRLTRADLEIRGIFHGEASYEGASSSTTLRRITTRRATASTATPDRSTSSGMAAALAIPGIAT